MRDERRELLTAQQVQSIFGVDRSTVYRMAAHGRLPALKFGRQWRFPADRIEALSHEDVHAGEPARREHTETVPAVVADAVVAVSAMLLGVTMVVTDMHGRPITGMANACPRLAAGADDAAVMAECLTEWRQLAEEPDLEPRFELGPMGFECARAFVRAGTELVAMVVAGGVAPADDPTRELHHLDRGERQAVLSALPRIAATLSRAIAGRPSAAFTIDASRSLPGRPEIDTRADARHTVEV